MESTISDERRKEILEYYGFSRNFNVGLALGVCLDMMYLINNKTSNELVIKTMIENNKKFHD